MSEKISQIEKDHLIHQIIEWLCRDNKTIAETNLLVMNSAHELSIYEALDLINEALEKLTEAHNKVSKEDIIRDHIDKYEMIYGYYKKIDHAAGMNKALAAKERLLNILKSGNKVVVKKSETIVVPPPEAEYDFSKLTPEQRMRFDYLMNKMRK